MNALAQSRQAVLHPAVEVLSVSAGGRKVLFKYSSRAEGAVIVSIAGWFSPPFPREQRNKSYIHEGAADPPAGAKSSNNIPSSVTGGDS